jgi:hypothetical protein
VPGVKLGNLVFKRQRKDTEASKKKPVPVYNEDKELTAKAIKKA